jgi:transposase
MSTVRLRRIWWEYRNERYKTVSGIIPLQSEHKISACEFLVKEGNSAAVIYKRLRGAYGDVCMGGSSVRRWMKHFKDGNTDIAEQTRRGRPRTAATERNKQKVDELIG